MGEKISVDWCIVERLLTCHSHDVMDPNGHLRWQHDILEKVCGQMSKTVQDLAFMGLDRDAKSQVEEAVRKQQIDSLSVDVSNHIVLPQH